MEINESVIDFNDDRLTIDDNHIYHLDGKPLKYQISVTGIIAKISKFNFFNEDDLDVFIACAVKNAKMDNHDSRPFRENFSSIKKNYLEYIQKRINLGLKIHLQLEHKKISLVENKLSDFRKIAKIAFKDYLNYFFFNLFLFCQSF